MYTNTSCVFLIIYTHKLPSHHGLIIQMQQLSSGVYSMSSSLSGVITSTLPLCEKHDPAAMIILILIFVHREKTYIKSFFMPGSAHSTAPIDDCTYSMTRCHQVPGAVLK